MESIGALLQGAGSDPWRVVAVALWVVLLRGIGWAGNQWVKRTVVQKGELDRMEADFRAQLADKDRQLAEKDQRIAEEKAEKVEWMRTAFQIGQTNKVQASALAAEKTGEGSP